MTDDKLTQSFITQQQLVENTQQALADLHTAMQEHGPTSPITAYFQQRYNEAHKAVVQGGTNIVDYYDEAVHTVDGTVILPISQWPQYEPDTDFPRRELATTQWVQDYVAKHLPKQPTTGSWSSPTNLAIAVLSGVLGGLIAALLGAALLLILP